MLIKTIFADDHVLVRKGFLRFVEEAKLNLKVYEASNGLEVLELMDKEKFELIFLDINMPKLNGFDTLKAALKIDPSIKVIAVSLHEDGQIINKMYALGAKGYILKTDDAYKLIPKVIKKVLNGELYYDEKIIQKVLKPTAISNFNYITIKSTGISFSEREIHIIKLICAEKSTKEIAEILRTTTKSIDWYRGNLLEKVGAKNVVGLALYAQQNGILQA